MDNDEQLLAEAIKRYPIGTKFICLMEIVKNMTLQNTILKQKFGV